MACSVTNNVKTYQYCVNCTGGTSSVTVTLNDLGVKATSGFLNSFLNELKTQTKRLSVSIPAPITCDLVAEILIQYTYTYSNPNSSGTDFTFHQLVIPAGQTVSQVYEIDCYKRETVYRKLGNINLPFSSKEETRDFSLSAQRNLPICGQPTGCSLTITSSPVTGVTLLGGNDGAIQVNIAGATGSSYQFTINGGTPQSSNLFSGLISGTYSIRVQEASCFDQVFVFVPAGRFQTSDFIVNEPASIVAGENPIITTIGTELFQADSTFARTKLTINQPLTDGYRIRFNLPDYDISFYAKDFPIKDSYFLSNTLRNRVGDILGTNSVENIAISLSQCLESDLFFNTNYYINQTGNSITLIAKDSSARFNLTPVNIELYNEAGQFVVTGITASVVDTGKDKYEGSVIENYSIYVEPYFNETLEYGGTVNINEFKKLTEITLPFSKDNIHQFDVSNICKHLVSTPKPDVEFTGFTTLSTYMRPFILKYGEKFPLVAGEQTVRKREKGFTKPIWVTNSALDFSEANSMTGFTGTTNVKFLTNSPNLKLCYPDQRELLYIIIPKDLGSPISVKADLTFWDGTTTGATPVTISTGNTNFGGVSIVNVSPSKLGFDQIESITGKNIKQADIGVYYSGGSVNYSEIKVISFR